MIKENKKIFIVVGVLFILKLIILPFSQTTHADAVSRVFLSINWANNPEWITHSIWAPFHFYINGIGLIIWDNTILLPKLINIIFSCVTLFPFYFFIKREFNKTGALIAAIFLGISPILFRYSFMALSETPYLFFLALTINLLSKGIKEQKITFILLAGITIFLAEGIRYEAWIVSTLFCLLLLLFKEWKAFFIFSLLAALFPSYWLITSYFETGDFLYSFHGTTNWSIGIMDNNKNLNFEDYLRRIWYYPFSWLIAIGIPACFIILKIIFQGFRNFSISKKTSYLSIPFFGMLLVFICFSYTGTFLLQQHYVGTLVLLSLPFIAVYFHENSRKTILKAASFALITILLSFIYNIDGIKPIPRLKNQNASYFVNEIKKDTDKSLIIDFIGWENTYFIALQSQFPSNNIYLSVEGENAKINYDDVFAKIENFNSGYLVLKSNSELEKFLSTKLSSIIVFQKEDITLYEWKK